MRNAAPRSNAITISTRMGSPDQQMTVTTLGGIDESRLNGTALVCRLIFLGEASIVAFCFAQHRSHHSQYAQTLIRTDLHESVDRS
jgi:hypothetical protein